MDEKSSSPSKEQLGRARDELMAMLVRLQEPSNASLPKFEVNPATERFISFTQKYQARLISQNVVGKATARAGFAEDIKTMLHNVVAVYDEVVATNQAELTSESLKSAGERYNRRATVLERFKANIANGLLVSIVPPTENDRAASEAIIPLQKLRGKSARDLFQIVTRITPVDQVIDDEITSLLYVLARDAHIEKVFDDIPAERLLLNNVGTLRELVASQPFREFVAPHFVSLLQKFLKDEEVEAFDDAFRNTYFAVVNRVINYYQTYRPEAGGEAQTSDDRSASAQPTRDGRQTLGSKPIQDGNYESLITNHELKPNALPLTPHALPKTVSDTPSPQSATIQAPKEQVDTSANATPLPPFDEPEPAVITPLLSEQDVEAITHEELDSLPGSSSTKKSPAKVTGTGLL